MFSTPSRRVLALACILLLTIGGAAWGQQTIGNLYGTTTDNSGGALPGVTITLTGQGAPKIQITDDRGQFRFLGLSPGSYQLKATLDSFSTVEYDNVTVNIRRNTTLEVIMTPAMEETITVTAESPLLDSRKITTGSTITQVELEKIPTARDPWVVLQSVPGVLVDRVNVGGNQSGQQSNFVGNGSGRASATWSVDGVTITDPASRGASPTYYNFDAFSEMQMSTGGSDVEAVTGGVQLNLVTKRGTNDWRGSGRFFNTGEGQADSSISASEIGRAGAWNATIDDNGGSDGGSGQADDADSLSDVQNGNITDSVDEYGFDIGGPIIKNKLWFWSSYSFQDIQTLAFGGSPDTTELENYAAKINAQLTTNNSLVAFYHYGDKNKFGRGAGAARPPETTWNQAGPTDIWKLEDTHIFSSNLFMTGMASYVGGGFQLAPQGGEGADIVRDEARVWHNTYFGYQTERPQDQARLDGSYFFNTGQTNHELKFGVGYRQNEVYSISPVPGRGLVGRRDVEVERADGVTTFVGEARHTPVFQDEFSQKSVSVQDTITTGRLTINAGLRYDLQTPKGGSVTIAAHPTFSAEMPEIVKPTPDIPFEWETISPRIGVTYALGEDGTTLLRASYSRFTDQLGTGFFNDLGSSTFRRGYFYWTDSNNNLVIDDNEVGDLYDIAGSPGTASANRVDPGFDPFVTDELVLGVERSLLPELVVGISATLRSNKDFFVDKPLVVDANGTVREATQADYAQVGTVTGTLPDGNTYSHPLFGLQNRDPAQGFIRQNSGLEQDFMGISLTINKRLANRWMLRSHFTCQDWTNEGRDEDSLIDPSRLVNSLNGDQVLVQSAGSGAFSDTWINSSWNFNIAGLYQVAPDRKWGFNLGADISGREGFANPYRVNVPTSFSGDGTARSVLVAPSNDTFRNDDIFLVNLRLEKEFTLNNVGLTVGVDAFNLLNNNTTLQREGFLAATGTALDGSTSNFSSSNGDWIREALSPRVLRFGVRLNFN